MRTEANQTHCQHWLSMIALVNDFVKYSNHHSSPIHNLFLTHESRSKYQHIGSICWAWLLCWMVLWNGTTTITSPLQSVCNSWEQKQTNTLPTFFGIWLKIILTRFVQRKRFHFVAHQQLQTNCHGYRRESFQMKCKHHQSVMHFSLMTTEVDTTLQHP